MKRWMSEPVTRAEAIGWALTIPAVTVTGLFGLGMVRGMNAMLEMVQANHPEYAPPSLSAYAFLGAPGIAVITGLCVLVPIVCLLTRQPYWVRIAAPVVCTLLVWSLQWHFVSANQQWAFNTSMLVHSAPAEVAPK